jgi:hypothetical protein
MDRTLRASVAHIMEPPARRPHQARIALQPDEAEM